MTKASFEARNMIFIQSLSDLWLDLEEINELTNVEQ
jgi:hypothetical protein